MRKAIVPTQARPGDVFGWNGTRVLVINTDSEKLTRQQQMYADRYDDIALVATLTGNLEWVPLKDCRVLKQPE